MSNLSKSLISQFASMNKGESKPQSTTLYGTVKMDGDKVYVRIDGSDMVTPALTSVNVKQDERVRVTIYNHEAVIVGNMSSVSARVADVEEAKTDVLDQVKENIGEYIDPYDEKYQQMQQLAANTLGFYYSEEKDANGATISYRHDKPTLAESTIIYKNGIDGFFLSTDGGQTWKAGFDSNGDAVLNILYAIGIQAKWINTRGLKAVDNNGNRTFEIDADTGKCYVTPTEFFLGDQTIGDMISDLDPNMEISKSGNTVTISYIDKNGNRQEYTVKDGQNGSDGSTPSLTSYQIWQLLLQTNTDFIYRGSDNVLYIKASHIDTGDFCGWTCSRENGKIYAYAKDFSSDSDMDTDGNITLDSGYYSELNGKAGYIKTRSNNAQISGQSRKYSKMSGHQMWTNTLYCYNYRNRAVFNDKIVAQSVVSIPNIVSATGSDLVITGPNDLSPGSGRYLRIKASSSFRYKIHKSFISDEDVENLYNLRPVNFVYKEGYLASGDADENRSIPGFYAELVDKYYPDAVRYNNKGQAEDWDPKKLLPGVLKLVQKQKTEIDELSEIVKKQQEQINELIDVVKTLNNVMIKQTYKSNN